VEPSYPEIERKIRKEGIVILEAIITSEGAVDEVKVLKSADAILDEQRGEPSCNGAIGPRRSTVALSVSI
jgi:hypothetical protein